MFTFDASQLELQISTFLLVLFRISSLMMMDVIIGSKLVSPRFRLMLALTTSIAVFPLVPQPTYFDIISMTGVMMVLQQILIGLFIAIIFQFVFQIAVYGGQLVAYQTGLGFARLVDPSSSVNIGVVGEVYYLACILLFLSQDGHLMVMQLLVNTFDTIPLSTQNLFQLDFDAIAKFSGIVFAGGVTIALPSVISLLIVNVTFAIMTRSAPQLNIFNIGFPITLILGFIIIFITFPGIMESISVFFQDGFQFIVKTTGVH